MEVSDMRLRMVNNHSRIKVAYDKDLANESTNAGENPVLSDELNKYLQNKADYDQNAQISHQGIGSVVGSGLGAITAGFGVNELLEDKIKSPTLRYLLSALAAVGTGVGGHYGGKQLVRLFQNKDKLKGADNLTKRTKETRDKYNTHLNSILNAQSERDAANEKAKFTEQI